MKAFGTIAKRFQAIGIESSESSRRDYRETSLGHARFRANTSAESLCSMKAVAPERPLTARAFVRSARTRQGIIPGIKVDKGAKPLALYPRREITEGLDGLRDRFAEYKSLGRHICQMARRD